jgi:anti-sigma B factor antagonist
VTPLVVRTFRVPMATLVTVAGEVDIATAPELRGHLLALPDRSVVVDMSEVGLLSAAGLSVLLDLQDRLTRTGARVVLTNAAACVRRVLDLTGLDEIFAMASTVEDAVELVASGLPAPTGQPARLRAVLAARPSRTAQHSHRSLS